MNNTSGCLVRSLTISASLHSSWAVLTPSIPHDDLSGSGQYEYYDEYHPSIGHGKITVYKSPDFDSNGMVNIIDLAAIALAYGSKPGSLNWNPAADLNNEGVINILDLTLAAFFYGRPI